MGYAFKMFNKDLTCNRGKGIFQYTVGDWIEEPEANCARNGFHCAENPLDCLTYYPDWENSVCYLVEIGGDIDEDGYDTKISCTRIRLVKELTQDEFIEQAAAYVMQHPEAPDNYLIAEEEGKPGRYPFIFVRGKHPKAKGNLGDTIVVLHEYEHTKAIWAAGVHEIDGNVNKPDTFYDAWGTEVP